jgi:hypothetical protein
LIRRLVLTILAASLPVVAVVASSVLPSAAPPAGASASVNAYWLVASDGGIFSFGGAKYYGSTGGTVLNKPVVGMAATHDGGGYWLVASGGALEPTAVCQRVVDLLEVDRIDDVALLAVARERVD